jgi:hypothetical protein
MPYVKLEEYKREKQDLTVQLQSYNGDTKAELIAARQILNLAQQAKELFMSSKWDEKQQLLRFFYSNLKLNAEKLDVELREPFKMMSATHDQHVWRPLRDLFLNGEITFGFTLQRIKTVFSTFSINVAV